MSIAWMNEVWSNSPHKGSTLLVHLALADNANDEGECWPGQDFLSKKSRMSDRNVRNALKALEESGDLEIVPRYTIGARQTTNIYRLKYVDRKIKPENIQPDPEQLEEPMAENFSANTGTSVPPENFSTGTSVPPIPERAFRQYRNERSTLLTINEPSLDPSNNNGHPQPFEVAPTDTCQRLIDAFMAETSLFIQGHLYDSHWREPCERLLARSKSYEEALARMRHGIEVARGNNPQGKTYALASPRSIMAAAMSYDPSGPKKPQPKKARGRPRYIPAEERETQIL